MKNILLAFTLLLFGVHHISAQCVIYICPETNHMGYSWNNSSTDNHTVSELSEVAEKQCIDYGGTDCKWWRTYEKTGWYGIIKYKTTDGRVHLGTSQANATQNEAEDDLNAILKENSATETIHRKTFRVYNPH